VGFVHERSSKPDANCRYHKSQHVIKTVPRRGFRLVAEVVSIPESIAVTQLDMLSVADKESRKRPVIAVLPFLNLSDDTQQQYLADGMTEMP
jgi:DNA-binding winged helix-turn-helix (wHTH) protein